jgi:hypothetical protein
MSNFLKDIIKETGNEYAGLVFREDMINAKKFLKSKTLIPAPDGQKNIVVSFAECKENFPRFIGPVYF